MIESVEFSYSIGGIELTVSADVLLGDLGCTSGPYDSAVAPEDDHFLSWSATWPNGEELEDVGLGIKKGLEWTCLLDLLGDMAMDKAKNQAMEKAA